MVIIKIVAGGQIYKYDLVKETDGRNERKAYFNHIYYELKPYWLPSLLNLNIDDRELQQVLVLMPVGLSMGVSCEITAFNKTE